MEIPIIYEDENLFIIDKPAGLVVNRADSVKEETLQDWAERKLSVNQQIGKSVDIESDFYNRSGIVHRLDKETSGLMIIAKTPQAFENLQGQFKNREVIKKYTALVHGEVSREGEIKATVGRLPWNRERFGVLAGGRDAWTSYKSVGYFKLSQGVLFTLVEVTPHTGRTHQIRIHFKYIGHPLLSDKFYAGRKVYRSDIKLCPRLFLHAGYIKFKNPENDKEKWLEFNSKLPIDLDKVMEKLTRI